LIELEDEDRFFRKKITILRDQMIRANNVLYFKGKVSEKNLLKVSFGG